MTTIAAVCPCRASAAALPYAALPYAACCGRYHAGPLHGLAPTAEALMRSRYSAFVLDLGGYLLATWHPRTRPAVIEPNPIGLKWLGLEVRHCALQDADHATVEFIARSKLGGRAQRLHETSRFVREDMRENVRGNVLESGRWFYLDGDLN